MYFDCDWPCRHKEDGHWKGSTTTKRRDLQSFLKQIAVGLSPNLNATHDTKCNRFLFFACWISDAARLLAGGVLQFLSERRALR